MDTEIDQKDIGVRCSVLLSGVEPEILSGWVYASNMQGFFLSLDQDGKDIRFIPIESLKDTDYDYKAERARFSIVDDSTKNLINELNAAISVPMNHALDRVDHNRVKRIVRDLRTDTATLTKLLTHATSKEIEHIESLVRRARDSHEVVLDEIFASGLADVLRERHGPIRAIASPNTLPQEDAAWGRETATQAVTDLHETDRLSSTNLGRDLLAALPREAMRRPRNEADMPPDMLRNAASIKPDSVKAISAGLEIFSGAGLAATNLTLGVVSGLVGTLPTLGLGTVPTAVGVGVSVFTGLNWAAKGLREVASISPESHQQQFVQAVNPTPFHSSIAPRDVRHDEEGDPGPTPA